MGITVSQLEAPFSDASSAALGDLGDRLLLTTSSHPFRTSFFLAPANNNNNNNNNNNDNNSNSSTLYLTLR